MSILSPVAVFPSQLDSFKYSAKSLAITLASIAEIEKWSAFVALDYLAKSIGYKGHSDLIQSTKFRSKSDQNQQLVLFGNENSRNRICEYFSRELSIDKSDVEKACSLAFIEVMKLEMLNSGLFTGLTLCPMVTNIPDIIINISEAPDHVIDAIEQHSQFLRFQQSLKTGGPSLGVAGKQKQPIAPQEDVVELTQSIKEKLEQPYKEMGVTFRIEKVNPHTMLPLASSNVGSTPDRKDTLNIPCAIVFRSKNHRPEGWSVKTDWVISLLVADCGTQMLDTITSWQPYRLFRNWLLSFSETGHFQVIVRTNSDEEILPVYHSSLPFDEIRENLQTEEDQLFFDVCFPNVQIT